MFLWPTNEMWTDDVRHPIMYERFGQLETFVCPLTVSKSSAKLATYPLTN